VPILQGIGAVRQNDFRWVIRGFANVETERLFITGRSSRLAADVVDRPSASCRFSTVQQT